MISTFNGIRILESRWLTDKETHSVRRTWRERLFSWPWHPMQTHKTVVVQVPSKTVLVSNNGTMIMHPDTFEQLKKTFNPRYNLR